MLLNTPLKMTRLIISIIICKGFRGASGDNTFGIEFEISLDKFFFFY